MSCDVAHALVIIVNTAVIIITAVVHTSSSVRQALQGNIFTSSHVQLSLKLVLRLAPLIVSLVTSVIILRHALHGDVPAAAGCLVADVPAVGILGG